MKAEWDDSGDERIFPSSRTTVPARTRMSSFARKESLWERRSQSVGTVRGILGRAVDDVTCFAGGCVAEKEKHHIERT